MPVFRPSCVVNLKFRFDETLTRQNVSPSISVQDLVANPPSGESAPSAEPLILQRESSGKATASFLTARIPLTCSIEKPGYRQAGRFNMTFDWRELPVDPRTIRSAAVEIHLGTVSDSDFAAGYRGRDTNGVLRSVLQTKDPAGNPRNSTLQMVAIVDEWHVRHDDSGSVITMSGRDLRGILLDTPVNAGLPGVAQQFLDELDLSETIDKVVIQILRFNPFFEDFNVVTNAQDWPGGKLPRPGARDIVPRHRTGARGNRRGGRATPPHGTNGGQLNFWDLIVRVCYLVGAIPYFKGTDLIIRPSATVYDKLRGPIDPVKNPTPFKDGNPRTGDATTQQVILPPLRTRKIVYGRDTTSLEFFRKYGGWRRPKTIRAISLDLSAVETGFGKSLQGIWPPDSEPNPKKTRRAPSFDKSMEEVLNIPAYAFRDEASLVQIAKAIYNEMGRGEVGGECETFNLASFGGDNSDPDLLSLSPGDGIEIDVDTRSVRSGAPLVSAYTDANRKSYEQQVSEILTYIPDPNLARTIVATARGQIAELQRFYRVENVKLGWDIKRGVKVHFDFQNYVVIRDEVQSNASSDLGVAKTVTTPNESGKADYSGGSLRSI